MGGGGVGESAQWIERREAQVGAGDGAVNATLFRYSIAVRSLPVNQLELSSDIPWRVPSRIIEPLSVVSICWANCMQMSGLCL